MAFVNELFTYSIANCASASDMIGLRGWRCSLILGDIEIVQNLLDHRAVNLNIFLEMIIFDSAEITAWLECVRDDSNEMERYYLDHCKAPDCKGGHNT